MSKLIDLTGQKFGRLAVIKCIMEWAKETGIPEHIIGQRLKHGWSIKKALITPIQKRKEIGHG